MAQATPFETRIARSDALVATLARASDYAAGQAHASVTLEHLLLALTEDADAARVLISNSVDLGRLRNDVASFLGQQPPTAAPGSLPQHDPELTKILAYAEAAARQSPRPDVQIDGAIVLAAIVGDGKSMAATFLKAQGLTFQAAIRVIRQSAAAQAPAPADAPEAAQPPPEPAPATPPPASVHEDPRVGSRAPPAQKPLWEPMGIPNIRPDPPPRPSAPPARKADAPRPAAPSPEQKPAPDDARPGAPGFGSEAPSQPHHPAPPPSPEVVREEARPRPRGPELAPIGAPPPPAPAPASQAPSGGQPSPGANAPIRRQPPPPAPAPPGPPPLPSSDAGRRSPEGPPPIPPRPSSADAGLLPVPPAPGGLGAARPPPPRPNLRLPQSAGHEPELTSPWPELPAERPPLPPPSAPAARPPHGAPDRARARAAPQRPGREAPRPGTEIGQLVENIPRRMKVGVVETVEVRIAREGVAAGAGLQGGGTPHTHQLLITHAMSVRIQGEPGRFYIEPKSPETQWTGARPDQLASDYAVWRFTVIPQVRGPAELTLIVASRSIGADGVIADSSLPEQRISIRISANLTRGFKRWAGWIAVAVLGGVLAKLGEGFWEQLWVLARRVLSI